MSGLGLTSTAVLACGSRCLYVELTAHCVSPSSDEDACRSTGLNVGRYSRTHTVLTPITGAGSLLTALWRGLFTRVNLSTQTFYVHLAELFIKHQILHLHRTLDLLQNDTEKRSLWGQQSWNTNSQHTSLLKQTKRYGLNQFNRQTINLSADN